MNLSKASILCHLLFLAIGLVGLNGCKTILQRNQSNASPTPLAPKGPDLKGRWIMGNAASGTEASTIVRVEQNGENIRGILEQPSKDYAEQFGVKKGDVEFEGVLDGRIVRGQVHSYLALTVREECPKLSSVTLKPFELSVAPDDKSLDGWTENNRVNMDKCQSYFKGRSPYTFQRSNE